MLLPTENTVLRRSIDQWLLGQGLRPDIVGEFEDSALLMVFGRRGAGVFPGPKVIAPEIESQYGVRAVGSVPAVRESLYAVTVERRIEHPAVAAISEAARAMIFGGASNRPVSERGPPAGRPGSR